MSLRYRLMADISTLWFAFFGCVNAACVGDIDGPFPLGPRDGRMGRIAWRVPVVRAVHVPAADTWGHGSDADRGSGQADSRTRTGRGDSDVDGSGTAYPRCRGAAFERQCDSLAGRTVPQHT